MSKINKRLFSVAEYMRMGEAGILSPTERVELIRGEIVVMSPIGPRHQAAVNRGNQTLVHVLRGRAIVQPQGPTELDKFAMPQPDFALLRPREDFYIRKHPGVDDIFLIIEVSDSSLEYDTTVKQSLYAILKIQEYWIVDIPQKRVFVCRDPHGDEYHSVRIFSADETISPSAAPEFSLRIEQIFA